MSEKQRVEVAASPDLRIYSGIPVLDIGPLVSEVWRFAGVQICLHTPAFERSNEAGPLIAMVSCIGTLVV